MCKAVKTQSVSVVTQLYKIFQVPLPSGSETQEGAKPSLFWVWFICNVDLVWVRGVEVDKRWFKCDAVLGPGACGCVNPRTRLASGRVYGFLKRQSLYDCRVP